MFEERKCRQAAQSTENLVKKKIALKSARLETLEGIKKQILSEPIQSPSVRILAVNLGEDVAALLAKEPVVSSLIIESLSPDNWKDVTKALSKKAEVDAVVLEVYTTELTAIDKAVLALSFMCSRPVLVLLRNSIGVAEEVSRYTGGTWPTFREPSAVIQYIAGPLPQQLALRTAIQDDIQSKVAKYKEVNKLKHALTRGAVAWIPFGVHVVNFAGLLRLTSRIMHDTGMKTDSQVKKTVGALGAVATAKTTAIDSIGDVYQLAVASSIMTTLFAEVTANGIEAGLATLDAVDFALLGSVSVVTGALAAWGAYVSRPVLVESIGRFVAMLQVHAVLNPAMRRAKSDADDQSVEDVKPDSDSEDDLFIEDEKAAAEAEKLAGSKPMPFARSKQISSDKKLD